MQKQFWNFLPVLMFPAALTFAAAPLATLEIGATAPPFTLPGVDGKDFTLESFADAPVLALIFTCNHCPTAQAYEERIKKLASDYRDKGVAVVAVSPNDPKAIRLDELGYTDLSDGFEDMKLRAEEKAFNFPYLYDGETQEMSREYGPVATPHVFVFDAKRTLRYAGRIDDSEEEAKVKVQDTRNAIDALLEGRDPSVTTTKVFGCSTKWSDKRHMVQEALVRWAAEEVALGPIDEAGLKALVGNDSEKLRLITVWATWCGPCVAEFPEFIEMHRMYRGRAFELVTVSADPPENRPAVHEFLKKNEASSSNYHFDLPDPYKLVEALDPTWQGALPYTLLVKPGGEIVYRQMGVIDPLEVKRAIARVLGHTYHQE